MDTIPCAIFILNTTYSPSWLSSLCAFLFPILSVSTAFTPTQPLAGGEISPRLFFNRKEIVTAGARGPTWSLIYYYYYYFFCSGTLFPKYIVTASVLEYRQAENCEILSLLTFFFPKHMSLRACV